MTVQEAQTWAEIRDLLITIKAVQDQLAAEFEKLNPELMLQEEKNTHLSNSDVS